MTTHDESLTLEEMAKADLLGVVILLQPDRAPEPGYWPAIVDEDGFPAKCLVSGEETIHWWATPAEAIEVAVSPQSYGLRWNKRV